MSKKKRVSVIIICVIAVVVCVVIAGVFARQKNTIHLTYDTVDHVSIRIGYYELTTYYSADDPEKVQEVLDYLTSLPCKETELPLNYTALKPGGNAWIYLYDENDVNQTTIAFMDNRIVEHTREPNIYNCYIISEDDLGAWQSIREFYKQITGEEPQG